MAPEPIPAPLKRRNTYADGTTIVATPKKDRAMLPVSVADAVKAGKAAIKDHDALADRLAARVGTAKPRKVRVQPGLSMKVLTPATPTEVVEPFGYPCECANVLCKCDAGSCECDTAVDTGKPSERSPRVGSLLAAVTAGQKYDTREAWMLAAVAVLTPDIAAAGATVPPVRISIGFPGGRGSAGALGQCWMPESVTDGVATIFVAPTQVEAIEIVETIAHELCHAVGNWDHRAGFHKIAHALGFVGNVKTKSNPKVSPALYVRAAAIVAELGTFPHGAIIEGVGPNGTARKVQTTRMLKVECPEDGYSVRTTAKFLSIGLPLCPDGHEMVRA